MIKKHNNLRIVAISVSILVLNVLIVTLIGKTFGFFQYAKQGEKVNIIAIKGLEIEIDNNTENSLDLASAFPMSDSEGLLVTPFIFTINNSSSSPIDYVIKLLNDSDKQASCFVDEEETIPCTLLSYQYIRYSYSINDGDYSEPATLSETGEIHYDVVSKDNPKKVSIKLWIAEDAPNSIQGNVFFGKILLVSDKSIFNDSLPSTIVFGNIYQIAREPEDGETITCNSDIDGEVTTTETLSLGKHIITCTSTIGDKTVTKSKKIEVNLEVLFATNSWDMIVTNVRNGNGEIYAPNDLGKDYQILRKVKMNINGVEETHYLRVANTTSCEDALLENPNLTSETACGFVIEFADIISSQAMNSTSTNIGGYPATDVMYNYVTNTLYNALPEEIRNSIIDTTVVSSHGSDDSDNFITTNQKLYLLDRQEVWADGGSNTAIETTRQLDYYKLNKGAANIIKNSGNSPGVWWLRTAHSTSNNGFFRIDSNGGPSIIEATWALGVSPAFRIG